MDPLPTYNGVFEYQPVTSEILTQPSRYNRGENNLLADENGPQNTEMDYISIHLFSDILLRCNLSIYLGK